MQPPKPVALNAPIEAIVSRPGVRVNCDLCGEEIMNEREIQREGLTLCRACAHGGYYQKITEANFILPISSPPTPNKKTFRLARL